LLNHNDTQPEPKKPKIAKWKLEHQQLMQSVFAAKGSTSGNLEADVGVEPYVDPSLVQCPHW